MPRVLEKVSWGEPAGAACGWVAADMVIQPVICANGRCSLGFELAVFFDAVEADLAFAAHLAALDDVGGCRSAQPYGS